jgi:hypothetical protein
MDLKSVRWATLDECSHSLASKPEGLPKDRIKQELLIGLLSGAISFRFEGDDWTPDDFKEAAIGRGGNSRGWAELRIEGDDPEAIAKLKEMRWQDYSEFFRRVYLDRFELATKTVRTFAPDKKAGNQDAKLGRGRKPKYAWKDFHEEVIRLIEHEGAISAAMDPSWNQAALEERMSEWASVTWGESNVPSESMIREHVKLAQAEK